MDILVVLGIVVAVLLMLLGLFLMFRRVPAKASAAQDLSASASAASKQIELPLDTSAEVDSAPTEPVISANQFITQTIHHQVHEPAAKPVSEPALDDIPVLSASRDTTTVDPDSTHQVSDVQNEAVVASTMPDQLTDDAFFQDAEAGNRLDAVLAQLEQDEVTRGSSHIDDHTSRVHSELEMEQLTTQSHAVETAQLTEWQGSSVLLDEHLADHTKSEEDSILVQAEHIIAFNLLPKSGRPFEGRVVLSLLRKHGLRFGEMWLFHRFEESNGQGPMMFSVLKFTKEGPAGFELETMEQDNFEGLTFFLALPGTRPLNGFDMMLSTAQRLATELYGQLYDDEMNHLTEQLKSHYRHVVMDFRPGAKL